MAAGRSRDEMKLSGCIMNSRHKVPVFRLDWWAGSLGLADRLWYIKVDVEGGEWAVLEGMSSMLEAGHVELMSFEYAKGWDLRTYQNKWLHSISDSQVQALHNRSGARTLYNFQRRLDGFGFDSFLLHSNHTGTAQSSPITM